MLKLIYHTKSNSPDHGLKKFYSPKIEKQNSKKVSSKLMNTLSIPDKKTKYNIKQSKLDKQAKSPQINQRNSFSLLKSFDSKVFRTSINIPLNVNKLIKVSKKKSNYNNNNNNNNNETLSF